MSFVYYVLKEAKVISGSIENSPTYVRLKNKFFKGKTLEDRTFIEEVNDSEVFALEKECRGKVYSKESLNGPTYCALSNPNRDLNCAFYNDTKCMYSGSSRFFSEIMN
jgi:hypothetical protein